MAEEESFSDGCLINGGVFCSLYLLSSLLVMGNKRMTKGAC
jgi:hypothetical protein